MCRLQAPHWPSADGQDDATKNDNNNKSLLRRMTARPIPTWVLIASLPLLPTYCYLNRGYTVWFHLLSISYLLTRSPFVRSVLVLQGTVICLGWYAAIVKDCYVEGNFCHSLYRNMPAFMAEYMVVENGVGTGVVGSYVILDSHSSRAMKVASHLLDTLGHPGLAYLFWRSHVLSGGTLKDLLTWPVIVFAWHLSRLWSLVHSWYNTGTPSLWYFGHDVYLMKNLDLYLIAYVVEGVIFGAAIACRLYWDRCGDRSIQASSSVPPAKTVREQGRYNTISGERRDMTPGLIYSESAVSTTSTI